MIDKRPNFLLVGAPKAGTTSIAKYLGEHPEVYIPREKEPFYFIEELVRDIPKSDPMYEDIKRKARLGWDEYMKLFDDSKDEKVRGEATVHYLYHYDIVIPKVKKKLGDIPIIIVLRNPVDRAFSNYCYQYRGQLCSFEKALMLEDKRKNAGWNSFWYYREVGNYCRPVSAYLKGFSNVYVCLFEELIADPYLFMQKIYTFLGVNDEYVHGIDKKYNATLKPVNSVVKILHYISHKSGVSLNFLSSDAKSYIKKMIYVKNDKKINKKTEISLYNYYENEIDCLEKILDIDLSVWRKCNYAR